jgi:signal transduction histidine kinase
MRLRLPYNFLLKRSELTVGEISFSGGDGLAFDPEQSYDWQVFLQQLAGYLELIVLREFLVSQQGVLAVGRMQALLAHEMKNPLAVIKVCSGLLQDHVAHSEEAEELIRTIQQEINRVSKAVQNVFNHSGREESAQNVDLFEVVEEVKKEVLARFTKQSIECSLEIDLEKIRWEPQCLSMWVQKEGLRQSLMNILVNAFEAGSDWAAIEIRLRSNQYFRISVRDRGPGIPSSIELFKPFVSSKPNGTGLGLSHVKAFVDRNSGRIQVDSCSEGGALITLEFSPQFAMKEVSA